MEKAGVEVDKRGEIITDETRTTTVPYSVFLNPPFSRVGMSEKEAQEAGYPTMGEALNDLFQI